MSNLHLYLTWHHQRYQLGSYYKSTESRASWLLWNYWQLRPIRAICTCDGIWRRFVVRYVCCLARHWLSHNQVFWYWCVSKDIKRVSTCLIKLRSKHWTGAHSQNGPQFWPRPPGLRGWYAYVLLVRIISWLDPQVYSITSLYSVIAGVYFRESFC